MGILSAGIASLAGLHDEKPRVPKAPKLDIGKETKLGLEENIANLPTADAFVREFNRLSADQAFEAMERIVPGYRSMFQRGAETYAAMARGEIPQSEYNTLTRRLAEKGISIGTQGSQFGDISLERERLGIDLDYIDRGLKSYMAWTSGAGIPKMNMGNVFLSTQDRIGLRQQESQFGWQRDWLASQIHAMASPEQRAWRDAIAQEESSISGLVGSVAGYAGGSATGGGGGGGL